MAEMQADDVGASFLAVGDLNDHNQEWLCSTPMNRHGAAALTSRLWPFVICWLSARPMHVVELLTSH